MITRRAFARHVGGIVSAMPWAGESFLAHRAMADAEVAAALLVRIQRDLERRYDVFDCRHELLVKVGATPKKKVAEAIGHWIAAQARNDEWVRRMDAQSPQEARRLACPRGE